jgi:cell fate regulator YaaT (PSP1 superfamily)
MSRVSFFSAPSLHGFPHRCKVILRTERGTEMGSIVASPREDDLARLETRPGEVLRAATPEDRERQLRIERDVEPTELKECAEEVARHKLPMKLLAAEHLFGGEKVVFYFTAEGRVDFRKLVREMARMYRTRIEFRQVGVRDEARLLAEYEHCGQPLCCRQFLRGLEPVTMRMAKLQKATLDPAKISGRCGRLMCCLRYEQEVYSHLRSKLPPKGVYVLTDELAGQVLAGDIISQRVTVNTGARRAEIRVGDIKEVSREPLEQPAPKIAAEPLTPAGTPRKRGSRRPGGGSEGGPEKVETDRKREGRGKGSAEGDSQGGSGSRRRGSRRRGGRGRKRRGRAGDRGERGGSGSGGKRKGDSGGGTRPGGASSGRSGKA